MSSLFYLIESLLALVLVWKLPNGAALIVAVSQTGSAAGGPKTAG
jgi:hypothetical protein